MSQRFSKEFVLFVVNLNKTIANQSMQHDLHTKMAKRDVPT
jgi:hypothetical protein